MKKRILTAAMCMTAIGIIFAGITANSQEDMEYIQDSAFKRMMRPPASFRHDAHNEKAEIEECNTCHHVFEDGKRVEGESSEDSKCSSCHAPKDGSYPMSLVKTFHARCKGCHEEKKAGPVMCAECDVK